MRTRTLVPTIAGAIIGVALVVPLSACKSRRQNGSTANPFPTSSASSVGVSSATSSASPVEVKTASTVVQSATGPTFLTSDGRYRVRAPGWTTETSSDDRNVLRITRGGAQALNMYEEKKIDFTATNIDEFMAHELALKKKYNQTPRGPVSSLTVGGRPARQVEVDVVVDDNRWRELLTIVDFPQEYLEVSVVVKPSKEDRASMQAVVQTVEAAPADAK